jgi:hypothetical protein
MHVYMTRSDVCITRSEVCMTRAERCMARSEACITRSEECMTRAERCMTRSGKYRTGSGKCMTGAEECMILAEKCLTRCEDRVLAIFGSGGYFVGTISYADRFSVWPLFGSDAHVYINHAFHHLIPNLTTLSHAYVSLPFYQPSPHSL